MTQTQFSSLEYVIKHNPIELVAANHEQIVYWQGKFMMVKNESNKLRKQTRKNIIKDN